MANFSNSPTTRKDTGKTMRGGDEPLNPEEIAKTLKDLKEHKEIIKKELENFKDDIKSQKGDLKAQKDLMHLGLIILLVMVGTMLLTLFGILIDSFGQKTTADYELTHAMDVLQSEVNPPTNN